MNDQKSKRIGIIGAGIAGLAAGWNLKKSGFDVKIFEKKSVVGGALIQATKELDGLKLSFFNGSGVEPKNYFNMKAFHYMHDLQRYNTTSVLDYHVRLSNGKTWNTDRNFWCIPAKDDALEIQKHKWKQFVKHIENIYTDDNVVEMNSMTVKEFFLANNYDESLLRDFLYPLMSNLYDLYDYQLFINTSFLLVPPFLYNINFGLAPYFVESTNREFINKLSDLLHDVIYYSTEIAHIDRKESDIELVDRHGNCHKVDHLIIAIHPSGVYKYLMALSTEEKNILSSLSTYQYDVILHTDSTPLSEVNMQSASFYFDSAKNLVLEDVSFAEYCIKGKVFRSVSEPLNNQIQYINPQKIVDSVTFTRDYPIKSSFLAKSYLHRLQGDKNTWYVGEGTVLPLMEQCFCSGLVIAEALGADYPFKGKSLAERTYGGIKNFMLGGMPFSTAL